MYDFIAIGDATLDVFARIDDASVMCELDNENCKLCLNYADKIAVSQLDFIIGGNAANAAVGARRLGLSSAFFSTVGDDDTGQKILDVLRQDGVSAEHITVAKNQASNYSVVINFQSERTILVHHVPRQYVWNITQPPRWLYLTSMGEGFEPVYEQVVRLARESHSELAYNPGTHQLKKGLEFLKPSLAASAIIFLNREEAAHLLSVRDQSPISDLLHQLKKLGPKIVVITDGRQGAYCYDGENIYHIAIYDGPQIERTGAGDAFGTAFTVAMAEGKDVPEAMRWGNANSTSVVAHIGPETGLLNQSGIHEMIGKNSGIQPNKL